MLHRLIPHCHNHVCVHSSIGQITLVDQFSAEFAEVSRKFQLKWIKGSTPSVRFVFAITNHYLDQKWTSYRQSLRHQGSEELFHGTSLVCDIATSGAICSNGSCGICGIACAGMDPSCIRKEKDHFQRFGGGFYLAPNSSKCHDYTLNNSRGHSAMLLCDVLPGRKYNLTTNHRNLTGPPSGYNSVHGIVGKDLNYPELVVYNSDAVKPRYIIVY